MDLSQSKKQKTHSSQDVSSSHNQASSFSRKTNGSIPTVQPPSSFERSAQRHADDKHFFERVKRALESREVFNEFLKLVNLFTQDYIDAGRLLKEAKNFLGENSELMRQFKEILGWDDRKEREYREAEASQMMFYGFHPMPGGKVKTGPGAGVKTLPGRVDQAKMYGSYRKLPPSVCQSYLVLLSMYV